MPKKGKNRDFFTAPPEILFALYTAFYKTGITGIGHFDGCVVFCPSKTPF
jgi:hypothetical protein